MENIIVRKIKLGDHISLKNNIYNQMEIKDIENNVINNVKEMEKGSNWTFFVAEYNNEIIGTIYLEVKNNSISKHIGELYSIVTAEKHQNKGVFKTMLKKVSEYAKELGLEILILSVRKDTIADLVYKKTGFIKYGELKNGIKEKKYYDKVFYYYNLDEKDEK